ncbi:MAG: hypothetical protein LJE85_09430 [Gammaproteobacteria bacterium]|jgi:hypothetical protein|nr:hypothetical protein [Gammaproteobacteria bacterium]
MFDETRLGNNTAENNCGNQPTDRKVSTFGVAPSPFNRVKLELAIIIVMGTVLFVGLDSITQDALIQTGLLFVAGTLGMVWIMWRSHRVGKRQNDWSNPQDSPEDQV